MTRQLPLVVVFGATACGKSRLAIELARRFGGEIVSADSMQVYRGLDIVTNKVSREEQNQAKHHMIDFLDPLQRYSVVDFREKTLSIVDNLLKNNRLPIVVGGTNYYIESLLWKNFVIANQPEGLKRRSCEDEAETGADQSPKATMFDSELQRILELPDSCMHNEEDLNDPERFFAKPIYHASFKNIASEKLWHILEKVDQDAAHLLPFGDKRRIIRNLQIIQRANKTYSGLLKNLNESDEGGSCLGGPLRFDKACVLWLSCEDETLHKVLDDRVDQMLERGLLEELEAFHRDYNLQRAKSGSVPDYSRGIFQAIGFKEFHEYLVLDKDKKSSDKGKMLLSRCVNQMKTSTRQYARRQLKWIRRRFMREGLRNLPPLFRLPVAFDEEGWQRQVIDPAIAIVQSVVTEQPLDEQYERLRQIPIEQIPSIKPGKLTCEPCQRTIIGSYQIEQHLSSARHKKIVDSLKRRKLRAAESLGVSHAARAEDEKPEPSANKLLTGAS